MELLQLRYFLTVARMLNISRAAQYHMIPQPAMSQTISRLEKELGKPLFNRHRNRLTLTKDGETFLNSVTRSIAELDMAVQNLNYEDGLLCGELILLVQQHRGTIVDCIVEFRKKYPGVSFRIFHAEEQNSPYDYDLCISCTPPSDQYSNGTCLITEKLHLMVAANHPVAQKGHVHFEDLKNEEFALLDKNNSLWSHTVHLCEQSGFEPKISMICGDLHCMTKFVAAGMAVTMGPELSWRGIINDKVRFIPTIPEKTRTTYVFWNSHRNPGRLRQTFLDFLIEYFANLT
ncbi:MAG: LysR family transcriptional regulator [Oscillospiraceae bacterium]|nr:LysR family transcriptional regulator [Oscillospiraceae bacterium]